MTDLVKSKPNIKGQLIYVMGASGVGKDSLLTFARATLTTHERIVFAHRYITRAVELNGENHIALSHDEFDQRDQAGCFVMTWQAHKNRYGIGIEIDLWLQNGITVIVNGSREYLKHALDKYPELNPVLISASKQTILERLIKRGRESSEQILERTTRASEFDDDIGKSVVRISNDGSLNDAGQALVTYIHRFSL